MYSRTLGFLKNIKKSSKKVKIDEYLEYIEQRMNDAKKIEHPEFVAWELASAYIDIKRAYLHYNIDTNHSHYEQFQKIWMDLFKSLFEFYVKDKPFEGSKENLAELNKDLSLDIGRMVSLESEFETNVHQLTDEQREKFEISFNSNGQVIRNNKIFSIDEPSSQSLDLPEPIFVIGFNGKVYFNSQKAQSETGIKVNDDDLIKKFNHSSFLSGDSVICGGTIATDKQGRITKISNMSGHYKPDSRNMLMAVQQLYESGADLSHAIVEIIHKNSNSSEEITQCNALLFLQANYHHRHCHPQIANSIENYRSYHQIELKIAPYVPNFLQKIKNELKDKPSEVTLEIFLKNQIPKYLKQIAEDTAIKKEEQIFYQWAMLDAFIQCIPNQETLILKQASNFNINVAFFEQERPISFTQSFDSDWLDKVKYVHCFLNALLEKHELSDSANKLIKKCNKKISLILESRKDEAELEEEARGYLSEIIQSGYKKSLKYPNDEFYELFSSHSFLEKAEEYFNNHHQVKDDHFEKQPSTSVKKIDTNRLECFQLVSGTDTDTDKPINCLESYCITKNIDGVFSLQKYNVDKGKASEEGIILYLIGKDIDEESVKKLSSEDLVKIYQNSPGKIDEITKILKSISTNERDFKSLGQPKEPSTQQKNAKYNKDIDVIKPQKLEEIPKEGLEISAKNRKNYIFKRNRSESSEGYESGYESEGGTVYSDQGHELGQGVYSRARKFKSKDGKKVKAILDPIKRDDNEIKAKYNFFKSLYPEAGVDLIENENTYRLVLPLIPGRPFNKIKINNEEEHIKLFLSAIQALKDCHNKGFVVVDLKEDNIHYDKKSGKSYLIDGGMSVPEGEEIHEQFKVTQDATAQYMRKKFPHYAPECISKGVRARADKRMDIYSLGTMMKKTFRNPSPELTQLIDSCQAESPNKRPTLDELEKQLTDLNFKHSAKEEEVIVDKNDEFFISLGKDGVHSFIMVGVIQDGKPILLGRVGKQNSIEGISIGEFALKGIFAQNEAELRNESLRVGGDISYSAYAINYNQYLQFTELLSLAQRNSQIECYVPDRVNNNTVIMAKKALLKQSLGNADQQEQTIVEHSHAISVNNTCRHTAIDLIEYTQGIPHLTDNVSRTFFRDLPLTANFSYGKPDEHFYVLPLPPSAYKNEHDNKNKIVVLTKIFQRMEDLLKTDPYSDITIQKFDALKKLYCQQANIPSDNLDDALNAINQWKNENNKIINRLRDQGFFARRFVSRSTTNIMVDEIIKETDFSKACSELENAGKSNPAVGNLLITVKKLKDDGTLSMSDLPRITQYLTDTTALIKDPNSNEAYIKHNANINDAFHRSWGPIIGGALLCIAEILLVAAAITVTVLTFGMSSPLTIPALAVGGSVAVAGVSLSATAFTAVAGAGLAVTGIAGIGIASKAGMFAHNATKDRIIATAMEEVSSIEKTKNAKADLQDLIREKDESDDNSLEV